MRIGSKFQSPNDTNLSMKKDHPIMEKAIKFLEAIKPVVKSGDEATPEEIKTFNDILTIDWL
jgi:hypothetical protein